MADKAFRSYKIIILALVAIAYLIGTVVYVVLWVSDGEPNMVFFYIHWLGSLGIGIFGILSLRRKVAEIRRATQEEEPKDDETPS
jgi:hypothetical protein